MISKENFIKYMNQIKTNQEKIKRINQVLNENCDDNIYCPPSLESTLVDVLEEVFQDESKLIICFIYDMAFGKQCDKVLIEEYGEDIINIKSSENLYDILIRRRYEESKK